MCKAVFMAIRVISGCDGMSFDNVLDDSEEFSASIFKA